MLMTILQAAQDTAREVSLWERGMGVLIGVTGLATYAWRQKQGLRTTKLGLAAALSLLVVGVIVMIGKAEMLIDPLVRLIEKFIPAG